jgi:hypothetical protein
MVISQLLSIFISPIASWGPDPEGFLLKASGPTKNKNCLKIGYHDNSSISYQAEPSLPAGIYVGDQIYHPIGRAVSI